LLFADGAAPGGAQAAATLGPTIQEWLGTVRVIDPACGAGAFLVGMQALLTALAAQVGSPVPAAGARLYGIELQPRAAQIARLRLWLQQAATCPAEAPIPAPATFSVAAADGLEDTPLATAGAFDIVIGNPPYVRQEAIGS